MLLHLSMLLFAPTLAALPRLSTVSNGTLRIPRFSSVAGGKLLPTPHRARSATAKREDRA